MRRFNFAWSAFMWLAANVALAQVDLAKDLVLHYTFEERTAELVPNVVGDEHTGRIHQAAFTSRDDNASLFVRKNNAPNGYIETADHNDLNQDEFTVAAWIKTRHDDSNGSVVCKHDWRDRSTRGFVLRCYSSRCVDFTIGAGGWVEAVGTSPIPANQWVHVAAQYDGKRSCVFFNGELEGSTPILAPYTPSPYAMRIGHAAFALERKRKFDGCIDDVMLWKRALSEDEMRALYTMQKKQRPRSLTAASITPLVNRLGDDSYDVRMEAQRQLIALDTEVLPFLKPHLQSHDPEVAWRARMIEKELIGE